MKYIDIQDQPTLTFGRTFQITTNGIRYRLFRSSVTVVVVAVAIAFLMNVLSESLVKRSLAEETTRRVERLRLAAFWVSQLTNPGTPEEIVLKVGSSEPDSIAVQEAAQMGNLSSQALEDYHRLTVQAYQYHAFFERLNYGRRRALVHRATGIGVFDWLFEQNNWNRFLSSLEAMKSIHLNSSLDEFQEFLSHWHSAKKTTLAIQAGRADAIRKVREYLGDTPLLEALIDVKGAFGTVIRDAGFLLSEDDLSEVSLQARRMRDMNLLREAISNSDLRSRIAGYLDITTGEVNTTVLWRLLRNRDSAGWFFSRVKEQNIFVGNLDPERAMQLALSEAEERSLNRAELLVATAKGGLMGMGERMTWLAIASLIVCMVGISNAMLMSVTERFREIATLKCLGALDSFIMLTFVMEACCLGVVGAFMGALAGSAIGLLRMSVSFGSLLLPAIPLQPLAVSIAMSVALGVILAALASVYPSLKAARLAPMEAMRIE